MKKGQAAHPLVFREYDIRGIINKQFHLSHMYDITRAILAYYQSRAPELSTLIVGFDGRIHSSEIKNEVIGSLRDL